MERCDSNHFDLTEVKFPFPLSPDKLNVIINSRNSLVLLGSAARLSDADPLLYIGGFHSSFDNSIVALDIGYLYPRNDNGDSPLTERLSGTRTLSRFYAEGRVYSGEVVRNILLSHPKIGEIPPALRRYFSDAPCKAIVPYSSGQYRSLSFNPKPRGNLRPRPAEDLVIPELAMAK